MVDIVRRCAVRAKGEQIMTISTRRSAAFRLAAICLGLTLVAGASTAQEKSAAPGARTPSNAVLDEYQIGAHDLIELSVFQVAELSRTVRVNSRGQVSLPLIGAIDAAGLTAHELELAIAKKLADVYLQDPQVTVFIKEF